MKHALFIFLIAGGCWGSAAPAQAQCHSHAVITHHAYRAKKDSSTVKKPFEPSRVGAYAGLLGLRDRSGTGYLGGDLEGYYFLASRWGTGLRGTFTGRMPAALPASSAEGAGRPLLEMYSVTWSNSLLLLDRPRWRVAALGGAGAGWLNLRDGNQQVPVNGGRSNYRDCGCKESKLLDTAFNPLTEVGLSATYKPRKADGPWLTVRGQYRQWYGSMPFGPRDQFSHYLLSVGVSLPDAPRLGR